MNKERVIQYISYGTGLLIGIIIGKTYQSTRTTSREYAHEARKMALDAAGTMIEIQDDLIRRKNKRIGNLEETEESLRQELEKAKAKKK